MPESYDVKVQARCDVCGRLVTAEVIRKELDDHGHEIWIAKCPSCGAEFQAACIGRETSEYVVLLAGQDNLAESFKQLYKLLQHAKQILGHIEARLRELEGELRTFGVLMPDGGMVLRPGLPQLGELSLEELLEALRTGLAEELLAVDDVIAKLEGIEIRGEICADVKRKKGRTYTYYRLKLYEDPRYHAWGKYLGKEVPTWARAGVEAHKLLQEVRPIRRQLEQLTAKLDTLLADIQGLLKLLRSHLGKADIILRWAAEDLSTTSENWG